MTRSNIKTLLSIFAILAIACLHPSCDLINPDETIPSFIHIDSISLNTIQGQGNSDHNIVDAWLSDNGKLVGVYELPADIPVLSNGITPIKIRPGIKVNGQVGIRSVNPFMTDIDIELELFPDSHHVANPTVSYKTGVNMPMVEGFDSQGMFLSATGLSESQVTRIDNEESYQGQTGLLSITDDEDRFECRTNTGFVLPCCGDPVILEFTYRCNHSFVVGAFSRENSGSFQIPILVLNASENWNRIYLSLTDIASSNPNFIDHDIFFGFIREEGFEGEINVYLDNIKLMH